MNIFQDSFLLKSRVIKIKRKKFLSVIICIKFYEKCYIKKLFKRTLYEKTMTSIENTPRKRVYAFQEKHSDKADSFTVHFQDEGGPQSILYKTLRRKEDRISRKW